ncbi:MAG: DUF3307 domain-containing protein [Verrucomicrobiaceae bacterium]|nr:DUF3307 domain-containing protein [Verrucomicrobiaceae bacterium]
MDGLLPFPAHDWATAAQVFMLLCIGHALMDFPLQGEFLAASKNRHHLARNADPARPATIWPVCMASHCLLHAGAVWLVTGCVILACVEFLLHGIIDYIKCEGWTSFNQDQLLHFACKAAYVGIAAFAA